VTLLCAIRDPSLHGGRGRLRESGADVVERCCVSLEESGDEGVATGAGDQLAFIEVEHLPARSDEYRRPRSGSDDDLAGDRLRRRGAVTRDCKDVGDDVVLCVGNGGPTQRVPPLPQGVVLVGDAASEVAFRVVVPGDALRECPRVEDVIGVRAASTHDACIVRPVGDRSGALTDGAASYGHARQERRWRRIEGLSDGLSGKPGSWQESHRSKERNQQ